MQPVIPRLRVPRALSSALGLTLSATLSVSAFAAEPPGDSLCEAISVDELAALGPLTYEAPAEGAPFYCVFEASGDGSYSLTLATTDITYDLMRDPESEEYAPGGRPATAFEGSLIVDLGETRLAITLDPGDSPDAAGVDPVDYALRVADIVVPALGVAPASDEETAAGDELQPPPVDGIEWGRTSVVTAAELIEADEGQAAVWQPLAAAAGVDTTELSLLNANARDAASGEILGTYAAIQVAGLAGEQLKAAIISWMGTVSGEDVSTDVIPLGGKDVTALSAGGELRGYLYVAGDIVHTFTMSEDDAARILEALP